MSTTETDTRQQEFQRAGVLNELRGLLRFRPLQLLALTSLLAACGIAACALKLSVLDLDVWWHLRTGDWIVQHAGFPHTGILSRTAANRPWAAYSWGYEVLLSRFYAWFGLMGVGIYGTLLTLMVAFSIYWMARRLSGRFWPACLLTAVTCYAFLFLMMPRPVYFSIALLCVTLTLLLESQRNGRIRTLYWLPLIFLLWANLHIQFIYGLLVVGVFLACNLAQRAAARLGFAPAYLEPPKLPTAKLAIIVGACVLATLIGPYSYHLYGVITGYSHSKVIFSIIQELQPLSFRAYENFTELLLACAAFFAVGWRKKVSLFKLALLVMTSGLAFRALRDSWLLCVAAAACIADLSLGSDRRERGETPWELAGVFASVALVLLLTARATDFNMAGLDRAMTGRFPVNAVNFVHRNPVPGPLYNTFDWGGFLSWYMPEYPVAIDGRTDLYGDELDKLLVDTQNGEGAYKDNPYLNEAGLVLLHRQDGLVSALELDPRFRKVYEDPIATVFVRQ